MSLRIISVLLAAFVSVSVYADELDFLLKPSIVYGMGVSRNREKADEMAFKDLAANLSTDVVSEVKTNNDGSVTQFSSTTVSTSKITIRNSKKVEVKEGNKWYVYRYIDLDSKYSGYEKITTEETTNVTQTVVKVQTVERAPKPATVRRVFVPYQFGSSYPRVINR